MSGIPRSEYRRKFREAENILRKHGYGVINPCNVWACRFPWIYKVLGYRLTLLYDLWHLLRCDGITMLDGWQHSRGARLEKATAEIFNIKEV